MSFLSLISERPFFIDVVFPSSKSIFSTTLTSLDNITFLISSAFDPSTTIISSI